MPFVVAALDEVLDEGRFPSAWCRSDEAEAAAPEAYPVVCERREWCWDR